VNLVGLGVSGLLWIAGAWSMQRVAAVSVASAPESWRERFASEYGEASAFRLRDAFLSAQTLRALAFWLPIFVLLDLVDVILSVQLGAAAAYAAWETAAERRRRREDLAEWIAKGLEPIPPNPRLSWSYNAALFAIWFGFYAAACLAARALTAAVR
jgi:hypothetical protein